MMYDELIKNLRKVESGEYCAVASTEDFPVMQFVKDAADAIEDLMQAVDKGIKTGVELARMHGSDATSEELEKAFFQGCELGYKRAKEEQWIPVTERLPEIGKKVLVFAYGHDVLTARLRKETENDYPVFECNGIYFEMAKQGRITHWMPLPEAPKEGE